MARNIFTDAREIADLIYSREEFVDQVAQTVITGIIMLYRLEGDEMSVRRVMRRNADAILARLEDKQQG